MSGEEGCKGGTLGIFRAVIPLCMILYNSRCRIIMHLSKAIKPIEHRVNPNVTDILVNVINITNKCTSLMKDINYRGI